MSAHLKQREERLQQLLGKLAAESAKGTPLVVEGKKDAETLRALGIEGRILTAKTAGKSFLGLVHEIVDAEVQEVILLLDFDRRGIEWTKRLKQCLEREKIVPNMTFWLQLRSLAGKDIKDIESLASYIETLKSKTKSNS